jgi:hypothetical protein
MANFTPLTGAQLLQQMVTEYTAEAATPAATDTGSTMGAIFEAAVLLALQIQQQMVYVLQVARLATSYGPDVDSFVNPFGIYRSGATYATGQETFSYNSGTQLILVGSQVQTPGGVIYTVIADPTNPNFNVNSNGYFANPTTSATVQCVQSGVVGNTDAGTITLPYSGGVPIPGNPTLTNPAALINGVATQTDDSLKVQFAQYISGGGEGTINSILAAIPDLPGVASYGPLIYSIGDQVMTTPAPTGSMNPYILTPGTPGWFTVVVNEANVPAQPPVGLIEAVQAALILNYRAAGIAYLVIPPTLQHVDGSGTVVLQPGYVPAQVLPAVNAAFTNFVNGLGLDPYGQPTICSIMAVYVALSQVTGVLRIDNLYLNSFMHDVQAPFGSQLVARNTNFITG